MHGNGGRASALIARALRGDPGRDGGGARRHAEAGHKATIEL